jgi:hypothetical protein
VRDKKYVKIRKFRRKKMLREQDEHDGKQPETAAVAQEAGLGLTQDQAQMLKVKMMLHAKCDSVIEETITNFEAAPEDAAQASQFLTELELVFHDELLARQLADRNLTPMFIIGMVLQKKVNRLTDFYHDWVNHKTSPEGTWMKANYSTLDKFCKYVVTNLVKESTMRNVQRDLFNIRQRLNESARFYILRASGYLRILNLVKQFRQEFAMFWTFVVNGLDKSLEYAFRMEVSRTDRWVNIRNYAGMNSANLEKYFDLLKHALYSVEARVKVDREMAQRHTRSPSPSTSRYGNRRSYDRVAHANAYSDSERRRDHAAYGGVPVPHTQHVTGHKGSDTPARSKWENQSPGRDRRDSRNGRQGRDRDNRRRTQTRPRDQGIIPPPVSTSGRDLSGSYPWNPQAPREAQKYPATLFLVAEGKSTDMSKINCFRCGKLGHFARDCLALKPEVLNVLAENNMIYHDNIEDFDRVLHLQGHTLNDLDPDTSRMVTEMVYTASESVRHHVSAVTGRRYVDQDDESTEDTSRSPVRSRYTTADSEGSQRRY